MKCPNCGNENRAGEQFCTECGAQLAVSGPSTSENGNEGFVPGASLQSGRYVITKRLGEGGMGSVLLAKDTRLAGKLMVIKVLHAENTDDLAKLSEDVRNFTREAETLAHLDHPLIPDVTDHFEEGMRYYMVMDYVEGENLEDWLERNKRPMKEQDALRFTLEVLDILEYLSRQQPPIVHRDIKPANIIIGARDKHAHLVDFGIARAKMMVGGQLKKTTALGTPGYAPPEQYQGYADPRSDLYALAATMHHLVTNRDPAEHAPFQYPPVRTLNPRISAEFERILVKELKPNANDRYQTPQEMRADVEAILAGTSILGTTDGYRLSDSIPLRALPPQPARHADALSGHPQTRTGQAQPSSYADPDYYQGMQRPQARPTYQQQQQIYQPGPYRQRPRQQPYGYDSQAQADDNRIMWQFILFIVAIIIIGLIAYLLFSSARFY